MFPLLHGKYHPLLIFSRVRVQKLRVPLVTRPTSFALRSEQRSRGTYRRVDKEPKAVIHVNRYNRCWRLVRAGMIVDGKSRDCEKNPSEVDHAFLVVPMYYGTIDLHQCLAGAEQRPREATPLRSRSTLPLARLWLPPCPLCTLWLPAFAGSGNHSSRKVTQHPQNPLPPGVRAIAALYALCGIYLGITGALMLLRPGTISMSAGAPLLFGLELAGPYMFLLMALVGAAVAWGLSKLNNVTRHAAQLIAITGIVMLLPAVSAATVTANAKALITAGAGVIVRVLVAWYLAQAQVAEQFHRK